MGKSVDDQVREAFMELFPPTADDRLRQRGWQQVRGQVLGVVQEVAEVAAGLSVARRGYSVALQDFGTAYCWVAQLKPRPDQAQFGPSRYYAPLPDKLAAVSMAWPEQALKLLRKAA